MRYCSRVGFGERKQPENEERIVCASSDPTGYGYHNIIILCTYTPTRWSYDKEKCGQMKLISKRVLVMNVRKEEKKTNISFSASRKNGYYIINTAFEKSQRTRLNICISIILRSYFRWRFWKKMYQTLW